MAGESVVNDSAAIRIPAVRCPPEEEQVERLPLSPVTCNVPAAASPGNKHAQGSPLRRGTFRDGCKKQAIPLYGSFHLASHNLAGGARGLTPSYSSASDAAQPDHSSCHRRHASLGSALSNDNQSEASRKTGRGPARSASLCSELSFSHIAEEAEKLALSLDAQVDGAAPWPAKLVGYARRAACDSLGHPKPTLHPDAPAEHQGGAGQESEEEVQRQGAPQHSTWATLCSDAAQHADSITGSGRKRARRSISAAASSSAGEGMAELLPAQHAAPTTAPASEDTQPDASHHRQPSNSYDQHLAINTETTLAVARAGVLGDFPSPGSSASDDVASPPPEHHRQAALVAARAVAQAMGMQARHREDMQAINCERIALAVTHESTLANLDKALKENLSLQGIMLDQAQQVGALSAAQEALKRQLEDQEKLQAIQCRALQQQESPRTHVLSGSPAAPEREDEHRAAQVLTVYASSSAQHNSQAECSSPGESAVSHAGTAQLSDDNSLPSRAPPPAQATPALYGSPAQTPLGSLHGLAHMLHTPQDMAAARLHASQSASVSSGAHGRANVSHLDSSPGEMGPPSLLDSPADSCGSADVALSHPPSLSRQPASLGVEAAGQMAWEVSSHAREEQDPPSAGSGSPNASRPSISGLASPTGDPLRRQHAASQHGAHMRAITEGPHTLFSTCGDDNGSIPGIIALPCSPEASAQPQPAAEQAWRSSSIEIDTHNPLFSSCHDADGSTPEQAWEHSDAVVEGHRPLCDSAGNSHVRSPDKFARPSSRASDGHDDQESAQMLIGQLWHGLQASRNEAWQAKQASERDQALEVYRMEGEEMAAELRRTQERLTSLQAERIPAKPAHHVSAMLGHDEDIAVAGTQSQSAMLHKTLELLAAARLQIASQAQAGSGQPQISPQPSPEARVAERTIAYLREDLEMRTEQLATAHLQLEIARSQIEARQGLIQALDQNEAQLQAQLEEAHEASQQARQEMGRLAGRLKEAQLALASSEAAHTRLEAELEQERAASQGLTSWAQQAQQGAVPLEARPEQAHMSPNRGRAESSLAGIQAQLEQLGVQHTCELEQERAASHHQESRLRQQIRDLTASVEEQRGQLAASAESRADLVEQQQVLADALALREQEVRELRATAAELRSDLGILESTLRASVDSRADAHERAEQLQQRLHEAEAELQRSQTSAQALAADLLESEQEAMRLTAAAAQAAEEPPALMPVFDSPSAEQPDPFHHQHQVVPATAPVQALQQADLMDSALEVHQLQGRADDWHECTYSAAGDLAEEEERLQSFTAQYQQLSLEMGPSTARPASEAVSSGTYRSQLDSPLAHVHSVQPGPGVTEAGKPPCNQIQVFQAAAAQSGPEPFLNAAQDCALALYVSAEPAAEDGQGKLVQLQLTVRQTATSTGAADAQACSETGLLDSSAAGAAAGEPEQEDSAMQEAAEPQECQQCNEFAQQLEDCIREYEGGQAEVMQLRQQLAAAQQGRDCPQCLGLAQQLEACMQAAEARVLHISQQVFARGEAAQQAQRALEVVTEHRDALAASLAEHMALLSKQAASLLELQALVSQRDATILELQDVLSACQQGPGDLSRQVKPSCAGIADIQQDRDWADAGHAESQQPSADVAGVRSQVGKLRMELAALTADRDHYRTQCDINCQVLTQLQASASRALGEANSIREQSAALNTAKSLLAAQLAAAQDAARAEKSAMVGEAAELEATLAWSQRTAQDATEAMQNLAAELQAALLEAAKCHAGEQYALRELQAQQGQLASRSRLSISRAARAPGVDPTSPAGEGQAQRVAAAATAQLDKPDQDRHCLAEAGGVQCQLSAALSGGPHSTPPAEVFAQPVQHASEEGSPVHSRTYEGNGAGLPSHEGAALSPISNSGSPRAITSPLAGTPAAGDAVPQEAALLSPVAAKQTPAAIMKGPWTDCGASQPASSLFKALPEDASPSDRLQWLACQVADEADAWEERGVDDVGILGRAQCSSSAAASKAPAHTLETAAERDDAAEVVLARLRLERRLLRAVTNLAVAVTNDALTGSTQAAAEAQRVSGFMTANQAALQKAGLDQTWASLSLMTQRPPCPDAPKLLQSEKEPQKMVLQGLDAEAVKHEPEQDLVLGRAARDVDSLCQSIYETFPGLEQSVPCFPEDTLGPCRLKPAELLELHVSRCKSGIERLLLNLLSAVPEHSLLGIASPGSLARESWEWQDSPEGCPDWQQTPAAEKHRLNLHLQSIELE